MANFMVSLSVTSRTAITKL